LLGKGYNKKLLSGVLTTCVGTPPLSNCATDVLVLCVAAVVPFAPLVQPVKVLVLIPVYVICSFSIKIVPAESNPVELATSISVSVASKSSANVVLTISSSCSTNLSIYSLY
jgi:hypothetical protein